MRIAQISTVSAPVREETGGSVESFVWLLTRELVRLGHEVTVFGTADSKTDGQVIEHCPALTERRVLWTIGICVNGRIFAPQ